VTLSGRALLLQLSVLGFAFLDTLTKSLFALSEGFRQLRQPGGAEKQKDHEYDDHEFGGTESSDSKSEHCLIHNFLFQRLRRVGPNYSLLSDS